MVYSLFSVLCSCFQYPYVRIVYVLLRSNPDTLSRFSLVLVGSQSVLLDLCSMRRSDPRFPNSRNPSTTHNTQETPPQHTNTGLHTYRIESNPTFFLYSVFFATKTLTIKLPPTRDSRKPPSRQREPRTRYCCDITQSTSLF